MSSEERNLEDPESSPDCVPVDLDSLALNGYEGEKDANDLGNGSVEDAVSGAVEDVGLNGGEETEKVYDGRFVGGRHEVEDDGGGEIEEVGDGRLGDRHAAGAGGWDEIEVVSDEKLGNGHRVNSGGDVDGVSSASSSGYAAEREKGSSGSGRSSVSDEIDDGGGTMAAWVPGKRHLDEDDASISWRRRKKHFFILSNSGKPIYSRYGDEHKLAGFSATLQAIISFVENGGDRVKSVTAGKHQVVFLVKGPIYLVSISCTEEPYESLRVQLELIYGQMILILTKSVNRCFEKNPKFDMTPLLGGTDVVFSSLIHSFSWNPATFLHSYTCLPLAYATRQTSGAVLQDIADSGVLFAILMCKHKVVSLVGAQKASLHPDDMLLLSNFVMSSESFRTSESFSPICLPRYNPMAFLYAYVYYLDVETYLMLLTTSSDAFYHLKDCRLRVEMVLLKSNVLSEVKRSLLDGGMHVEDLPIDPVPRSMSLLSQLSYHRITTPTDSQESLREAYARTGGPAGLWHFIYRSIYLDQYVASEFSPPINTVQQQKRLYRAYQKIYASMHDKGIGPHKTQFRRDENYVLLCWVTQDFELYAAFDPLADKALAIKTCNSVCQWVKDVENEIFLLGASPFSCLLWQALYFRAKLTREPSVGDEVCEAVSSL